MQLSKEVINGKYRIAATSTTFGMNGMTTNTGYVEFTEKDEEKVDELIATCNNRKSSRIERNLINSYNLVKECIDKSEWVQEMIRNNIPQDQINNKIMERFEYGIEQMNLKEQSSKLYQVN